MNVPLYLIRAREIYLSSKETAAMVKKSVRWVQANRFRFSFRRQNGKRNLEFELSSILSVWNELRREKGI